MADLILRGGMVVTPTGTLPLDIAIAEGRVAALLPQGAAAPGQVIDVTGRHVLPGAVDVHVHVRAPSFPARGTVASETRAAAAGGITTLFEMPISKPCAATPAVVRARRLHFERDAYVNFALYGAPGRLRRDEIAGMVDEGVIGFKIFTTAMPEGREDEFVGLSLPEAADQAQALSLVAETGHVLVVHAEANELIESHIRELRAAGRLDMRAHNESRPPIVEATAIQRLLELNRAAGARVHIAHVTGRLPLEALAGFQASGMDVTGETCPHYLLCTEEDLVRHGAYAKYNPPLRGADDRQALWEGIAAGTLRLLATDHSPFSPPEKDSTRDDVWAAPPGHPGLESLLLFALDCVRKRQWTLEKASIS